MRNKRTQCSLLSLTGKRLLMYHWLFFVPDTVIMVNGLHLHGAFLPYKALHNLSFIQTHNYGNRAAVHWLSVLPLDTSTHWQEEPGIEPWLKDFCWCANKKPGLVNVVDIVYLGFCLTALLLQNNEIGALKVSRGDAGDRWSPFSEMWFSVTFIFMFRIIRINTFYRSKVAKTT